MGVANSVRTIRSKHSIIVSGIAGQALRIESDSLYELKPLRSAIWSTKVRAGLWLLLHREDPAYGRRRHRQVFGGEGCRQPVGSSDCRFTGGSGH